MGLFSVGDKVIFEFHTMDSKTICKNILIATVHTILPPDNTSKDNQYILVNDLGQYCGRPLHENLLKPYKEN